jgi:hypothetical protein
VVPHLMIASGFGAPPAAGGKLAAWLGRCMARESVASCAAEAQAVAAAVAEMVPAAIASGHFQREYRDHRLEWMMRSGGQQVVLDGLAAGTIRFSREVGA